MKSTRMTRPDLPEYLLFGRASGRAAANPAMASANAVRLLSFKLFHAVHLGRLTRQVVIWGGRKNVESKVYNPFNNAVFSTIAAALPVITLLVLIASGKVKAHIAAIVALIVANLIAIYIFTMPANMSLRATVLGAVTGFFPIGWIVLNVIFLYQLTVEKGAFETLQNTIGSVTNDRRLQLLLIAFSFGAFFESASGNSALGGSHRRS